MDSSRSDPDLDSSTPDDISLGFPSDYVTDVKSPPPTDSDSSRVKQPSSLSKRGGRVGRSPMRVSNKYRVEADPDSDSVSQNTPIIDINNKRSPYQTPRKSGTPSRPSFTTPAESKPYQKSHHYLASNPDFIHPTVVEFAETSDGVLRRVLLEGETVLAHFECYYPSDDQANGPMPIHKLLFLSIITLGLYSLVISCYDLFQSIRICSPKTNKFVRGKV